MKNKTLAVWITFLAGPLGLHRIYLRGRMDALGWCVLVCTTLGLYGVLRASRLGLDDPYTWFLLPLLGVTLAACGLTAIVYGLMSPEKWNQHFNPSAPADATAGATHWGTIAGIVLSLFLGTTILMASCAFGFQRYFESQIQPLP